MASAVMAQPRSDNTISGSLYALSQIVLYDLRSRGRWACRSLSACMSTVRKSEGVYHHSQYSDSLTRGRLQTPGLRNKLVRMF